MVATMLAMMTMVMTGASCCCCLIFAAIPKTTHFGSLLIDADHCCSEIKRNDSGCAKSVQNDDPLFFLIISLLGSIIK